MGEAAPATLLVGGIPAERTAHFVMDAARAAGLIDNKVVRLSQIHTALRLVVALARR